MFGRKKQEKRTLFLWPFVSCRVGGKILIVIHEKQTLNGLGNCMEMPLAHNHGRRTFDSDRELGAIDSEIDLLIAQHDEKKRLQKKK
jgi:hypothetical protein